MRLLDTETGQFVEKDLRAWTTAFAILSHTWDTEKGEQTYKELKKIQRRYGPLSHVSQRFPDSSRDIASSSPEQNRGGPSFSLPPSQLPDSCPSLTTSLIPPSTPSKPWFTCRIAWLKRWFQCCSPRMGSQNQSDTDTDVPSTPSSAHAPRSNDDLPPLSSDPCTIPPEQQAMPPSRSIWDDPELSPKIRDACAVARKNGYRYIWIDSCCIDKSSSSELSEAINSMYKWYSLADVCYAYLADVPPGKNWGSDSCFRNSRWFKRGWTLQELIAPVNVEFLSRDWAPIGSKHTLDSLVEDITRISRRALLHLEPLDSFSVAQRFSWAARRRTTREEDEAYSMLGIFGIHMPTLYGEGSHAFRRLQEQIMQRIPDQSLFAWGRVHLPDSSQRRVNQMSITLRALTCEWGSPSAPFPHRFSNSRNIRRVELQAPLHHEIRYTSTPYGIRTQFQMLPLTFDLLSRMYASSEVERKLPDGSNQWYLAVLGCEHTEHPGYLLGKICYIPPSKSGVEFMYTGHISSDLAGFVAPPPDLFPLSPEIIEHSRPRLELKTVHIPHPNPHTDHYQLLKNMPYNTIKLVLLTETCEALRSRGYCADLRAPDSDHPTTHWLTLSNDGHTITVEFQHTLETGGWRFTINAEVKMSGSRVQPNSAADSDQADHHTVSWSDSFFWWKTRLGPETVELSAAGAGTLTVGLSLDFAGTGVYFVRVDIQRDALPLAPADVDLSVPASSAAESAGEKAREMELCSHSGTINAEDSEAGWEVERVRHGMVTSADVDAQDLEDAVEVEDRGRAA